MSHVHLQYTKNICAKFQIDCLYTLGGADCTNLLPYVEVFPQNCRKCYSFVKMYFFFNCRNSQAHLQYIYYICVKFQTDCLKRLVGDDYIILLPYIEAEP